MDLVSAAKYLEVYDEIQLNLAVVVFLHSKTFLKISLIRNNCLSQF